MKIYDLSKEKLPDSPSGLYCVIYKDGSKEYYKDGKNHRDGDLPAVEYANGSKAYYKEGKCHRTTGPAIILSSGNKEYWLNGIRYPDIKTDEEWIRYQKLLIFL